MIHKVSAHLTRHTAISEGWEADWDGNDVADELAKDARPEVDGQIKSVREVVCGLKLLPGWAGTAAQVGSVCNPAGQQHVGMSWWRPARPPRPGHGNAVPV